MKTIKFFSTVVALAFVFSACNKELPEMADDAGGAKAAVTLPGTIAPFESVAGATVDAKAFDKFGKLYDPRDEGKPLYIADGIFFVKMKPSNEKNAKMANILVFEGNPTPGVLTVQTKINGNKCFSYVFNTEAFANKAFWVDNGTSVRYVFVPAGTPQPTASISGTVEGVGEGITVELHKASLLKASIPGYDRVASTTTTAGGYYCFNNLEQGTYIVVVIIEGKEYVSQPVPVNNGQTVGNVNITPDLPPVTGGIYMTMTTEISDVWLRIAGSGMATIDWGDGSAKETVEWVAAWGNAAVLTHTYDFASAHTITITGDNITELLCDNNQLTNLDVCKNIMLKELACHRNQLKSLDVSKNTLLTDLLCFENQLKSLDVSKNTMLTRILCPINQLTSLDVSKNTVLDILSCYENQLTSLDVSKNVALTYLDCAANQLTILDVSKNTVLDNLFCGENQLTSLDVSKNTVLSYLSCSDNQLTSLDVSTNILISMLFCGSNQLSTDALNALFFSLPNHYGMIFIGVNPGTNYCDKSIAESKGWRFY